MSFTQEDGKKKWSLTAILIVAFIILMVLVIGIYIFSSSPKEYITSLPKDAKLNVGDKLLSRSSVYEITIGSNRITRKKNGITVWFIDVPGIKHLYIGSTGKLVADSSTTVGVWKSPERVLFTNSLFVPGSYLKLQDDGNLIVVVADKTATSKRLNSWNGLGHFSTITSGRSQTVFT
jgi:hypothetical protein